MRRRTSIGWEDLYVSCRCFVSSVCWNVDFIPCIDALSEMAWLVVVTGGWALLFVMPAIISKTRSLMDDVSSWFRSFRLMTPSLSVLIVKKGFLTFSKTWNFSSAISEMQKSCPTSSLFVSVQNVFWLMCCIIS